MAFVANARPKQARQAGLTVKPPKTSRTRILVPAEQGNRVRIPDTERIHRRIAVCTFEIASVRQDSESSCDSKVLFSMRGIPACGENRSLEELSWLREKAEAMRLCEGKSSAHEWISQKTYKPRNERNLCVIRMERFGI